MRLFDRYKEIVPDWPAFVEASRTPLPTCIWTNSLRTTPETVEKRLHGAGLRCEPVSWQPGAFRLPADFKAGSRVEYLAGFYHVQEEVAMLPALVLNPKPGDKVLDLCAAPGNKTAQMAVLMQNRGAIVANEISGQRMRPLRQAINRLGLVNVTTSMADATAFPRQTFFFDAVMADVVCSCEGTSRKNPEILQLSENTQALRIQSSQIAILKRALQLCKPGGRVLYATCAYAPEENEIVLQTALAELADKIPARILSSDVPGVKHSPGLERWQGRTFRPDMRNAWRIYPHQNDTGGFFFALIEKLDDLRRFPLNRENDIPCSRMQPVEEGPLLDVAEERFGIPREIFSEYELFRTNSKIASMAPTGHLRLRQPEPKSIGLPFIHINMKYPKLTTAAAMFLGPRATRHVLSLSREQADAFLRGETFAASREQIGDYEREGRIILKFEEMFLGTGIFFQRPGGGEIFGQFPKAWQMKVAL